MVSSYKQHIFTSFHLWTICTCICVNNLYLYLHLCHQLVFVFVWTICICICVNNLYLYLCLYVHTVKDFSILVPSYMSERDICLRSVLKKWWWYYSNNNKYYLNHYKSYSNRNIYYLNHSKYHSNNDKFRPLQILFKLKNIM